MSYDEHSTDAMFSKLLERMNHQDAALYRIEAGVDKTNGRVTRLEHWRDIITAKVSMIALTVSGAVGVAGWLLNIYFSTH